MICIFLFLSGVAAWWISQQPYEHVKAFLDHSMPDRNFKTLSPRSFPVLVWSLRLFALASWASLPVMLFWRRKAWEAMRQFFGNLWQDGRRFLVELKPYPGTLKAWLILGWIMILAGILRLKYIQAPMRHDESYTYAAFASSSLWATVTDYHLPNNHVFHSLWVNITTHLLGRQPWAVRLPVFISGLLLIVVIYQLAIHMYDRNTAFASALLAAYMPVLIYYSTNARGYMLMSLLWLLTLLLGLYVLKQKNRFAWGLMSVLAALGFYTVPVMLFPYGVLCTWLFFSGLFKYSPGMYLSRRDFLRYVIISGISTICLTVLLYLPIMVYSGFSALSENSFVAPLSWSDFPATLWDRLRETWQEWVMGIPPVLISLLVIGFVAALCLHSRLAPRSFPLQIATVVWIGFVLMARRPNAWGKIWVFLIPLVILWSMAGLVGLCGLVRLKGVPIFSWALAIGLMLVSLEALTTVPTLPAAWSARGDVEQTAVYLKSQIQEQDKVIITSSDGAGLWYYFKLYEIPNHPLKRDIPFQRAIVIVDLNEHQTLDTVLQDPFAGGPYSLDCGNRTPFQQFGHLDLYSCTP